MSFQVYNQISTPQDHVYKLVQLPPDLVAYMKDSKKKPLQFKSPVSSKNHLVLCTDDSTYTVRQMNHSNTVLLVNDMAVNKYNKTLKFVSDNSLLEPNNTLLAIGLSNYQYELNPTPGYIDTQGVAVYDGKSKNPTSKTLSEVMEDSPIATSAFYPAWYNLCGCEVDGHAVILSSGLVTEVLHMLISILISLKLEVFQLQHVMEKAQLQSRLYTENVLHTITEKFCEKHGDSLKLDKAAIARWFGIETLKQCQQPLPDNEVLLKWKSSLPAFFNAPLDLSVLHGYYCRPTVGKVRYLPRNSLAGEIHTRIKELFLIVNEWDYDEFLPFVEEFIPSTKKPEAVIMKYARKKRVGKNFVVCPR